MLSSFSQKGMIEGEHMQEWFDSVGKKFVLAFVEGDRWKLYFKGLGVTLEIALFAAILGMVIGTVVALMRLSQKRNGKKTIWARIAGIYVDVIRGTPSVLQLLIMWFIVMKNSQNGVLVASLSFGINSGAYVSEIVRAGIPQAIKNVLPPIGNEFIVLLKETAIVGYVSLTDLTRAANQITSRTYEAFMPLIGAAVIYFTVIKILTILLDKLERRLRKSDNR